MLFVTSAKLAALIVLGVPATLVPILLLGRRVRRLSRATQDRVADVSAHVDESLHEIRTVQAYGHEDADRAAFGERAEAAYAAGRREHRAARRALISSVMLIAFCAVGVILWIGGHDVLAGRLTAGELSAFVFYAAVVATGRGDRVGSLGRAAARRRRDRAADGAARHAARARRAGRAARGCRARRRRSELDEVTFAYPARPRGGGARSASRSPSPPASASRWSARRARASRTVFALLLRFYDPQAGARAHRRRRRAALRPARAAPADARWCRRSR